MSQHAQGKGSDDPADTRGDRASPARQNRAHRHGRFRSAADDHECRVAERHGASSDHSSRPFAHPSEPLLPGRQSERGGFLGARSVADAGLGISITYLGLAFQQLGLLTGFLSFWVLIVEDVGRWVRRLVMLSGISLLLGASTVILGYQLLNSVGVPTVLGYAWLPTLGAGLIMVVGGRLARRRLISTWYWDSPEIVQP